MSSMRTEKGAALLDLKKSAQVILMEGPRNDYKIIVIYTSAGPLYFSAPLFILQCALVYTSARPLYFSVPLFILQRALVYTSARPCL